jgi:hypothetical protein
MAAAGDNILRDPIPNGIFDQAYRIRAFVTVPDFAGWKPEDKIHIFGLELGDEDQPIAELPGIYLKAGRLYGTHALTAGIEMLASTRYCVETSIVINGIDGTVDQTVKVAGVEVGAVFNATPAYLDPPTAALAGVSPSTNSSIIVLLGSPVWNTQPIGCGEAEEAPTDPIYPGENGYPFLPGDDFFGEPYWPPDTTPIGQGEPGYPYLPEDPRYGDLYYPPPPEGSGSAGTIAVQIEKPADGTVLSNPELLIEIDTLELSAGGGVPLVEIWVDTHRVGEAFGDPPIFFWEWFGAKPGPHQLRAVAKSTSGARVYSSPVTVYVPDISQPDIVFLSPPVGEPLSGVVEVAVDADDDVEVAEVEFFVDGYSLGTVTRSPFRVTLDLDDLATDEHELRAIARDTSGNEAEATRLIDTGQLELVEWDYPTMSALAPPVTIEIDFENDPFIAPLSTAMLGSQPWAYLPMTEEFPEESVFTEDITGLIHTGRLFGTWEAADGGGFKTTAMRTSGIVIPAPARRPTFSFGVLVKPREFGESFPMRLLDTGGLRFNLGIDGSLAVEGALSTGPGLVPAGIPTARHVALVYDADVPSVGTSSAPSRPGAASYMAILVDGEVAASKTPLTVSDALLMARSTTTEWVFGGGAGEVTVDELTLHMRALDAAEWQSILATRDNPPSSPDVWTDVTEFVRGTIETSRGRWGRAEHAEVGSMILTLDNTDRRFEPEHTASPYFPGITSNRKIRFRAQYAYGNDEEGFYDWADIWRGYVVKWPQTWGMRRSETTIECVGNFVRFGHSDQVSGDYPAERTGARLARVLDSAAVPETERDLDLGRLTLVAHRVQRSDARYYADQAADSEFGIMFEDAAGRIAFHDRDHRVTDRRSVVPRAVLGDGGPESGELPYVSAEPGYDTEVINEVRVEWPNGVTQVAVDGASRRKYGPNDITVQTLLASELSAARLARTILDMTAEPRWSFPEVVIRPSRLDRLWDVALLSEISDRHIIRRRPPGGGALLSIPVYVEAVRHSIEMGSEGRIANWLTSFTYSTVGRALPVVLTPFVRVNAVVASAIAERESPAIVKVTSPTILAAPAGALALAAATTPGFAAVTLTAPPASASAAVTAPLKANTTRLIVTPAASATAARVAPLPLLRVLAVPNARATASITPPKTNNVKIVVPPRYATAYASGAIPINPLAAIATAWRAVPTIWHVDNEVRVITPPASATARALGEIGEFGSYAALLSDFTGSDENPISESGDWAVLDTWTAQSLQRIGNQLGNANTGERHAYWTPDTFGPDVEAYYTVATKAGTSRRVSLFVRVQDPGTTDEWDGYGLEIFEQSGGGNDFWDMLIVKDFGLIAYDSIDGQAGPELTDGDLIGVRVIGRTVSVWHKPVAGSWTVVMEETDEALVDDYLPGDDIRISAAGKIAIGIQNTTARLDDFYAGTIALKPRVVIT